MKNIKYLLLVLMIGLFSACKSLLPQESTHEISLTEGEGRHEFQVNYDKALIRDVYLDNVKIKSGVKYYVLEGKYWLRYSESEKFTFSLGMSYQNNTDSSFEDNHVDPTISKKLIIKEDKIINLKGYEYKLKFQVGTTN